MMHGNGHASSFEVVAVVSFYMAVAIVMVTV
jgi:hypothetical protein